MTIIISTILLSIVCCSCRDTFKEKKASHITT